MSGLLAFSVASSIREWSAGRSALGTPSLRMPSPIFYWASTSSGRALGIFGDSGLLALDCLAFTVRAMIRLANYLFLLLFAFGNSVLAQMLLDGRLTAQRWPGNQEEMPLSAIYCFASLDGSGHESFGFRTFETEPPGWFRISGPAGNYSLLFTQPAQFIRPLLVNKLFTRDHEKLLGFRFSPQFDFYS